MPTRASSNSGRSAIGQIQSIQAFRAIAALFVVGFHSTVLWHEKFDGSVVPWENGNAGVDLFFVISGFIMVLSSRRMRGRSDGWRRFVVLRLVRIAPMYWLATAAKLAAIAAVPALALHTRPTAWNTVASFLFVPSRDATGLIRPVLDVGWTLSFEMLFYLAFASALFFMAEPLLVAGPIMLALAGVSLARTGDWPAVTSLASPILLEFVFGMLIGGLFMRGWLKRPSSPWMIAISVAGLLCLGLMPASGIWGRVAIWGIAAATTLAAGVLADRWLDPFLPAIVVRIGEASYSLYLTHGFVLPVVGLLLARTGLVGSALGVVLIASCLLASTLTALLVYRLVEVPVTAWLRLILDDKGRLIPVTPQGAI